MPSVPQIRASASPLWIIIVPMRVVLRRISMRAYSGDTPRRSARRWYAVQ